MTTKKINKNNKTIALLAIGNELVEGQIQDTNSFHFSSTLTTQGASLRHQRQVTDNTPDIIDDIHDLLSKNEALIITGGLGPTSDDKTRHAVSEALQLPLYFNEPSWDKIKTRLTSFGLSIAPSNRQQALFPEGSVIIANENGSAEGAHITWNKHELFMLPGPPNECWPMFQAYVLPYLKNNQFFKENHTLRFLTLGLIEGEIAPLIDEIAKPFEAETGYRWTYPYIEIKLKVEHQDTIAPLKKAILDQIQHHLVSTTNDDALSILNQKLADATALILSLDGPEHLSTLLETIHPHLICNKSMGETSDIHIKLEAIKVDDPTSEILCISFNAFRNKDLIYTHIQKTPYRSSRINRYIEHYCAWQINQLLDIIIVPSL